ncbi:MAG: PKD domain-containing protein, partial [Phaeodactylibacter sp.]|nr:PKD domain-containing protein [Phaeodactylibacter sp.]
MKILLISTLLLFLFLPFFQSSTPESHGPPDVTDEFCAQAELHRRKLQEDETYRRASLRMEEQIYTQAQQPDTKRGPLTQYTLPVVVHIVHDGGGENISDARVADAIQHLNDAFANVGYYNPATGVDTEIAFCLARRGPQGGATTGVNRVQSALTDLNNSTDDQALKNLSRWDPTQYINVWVVREICSNNGCGVAGYAYLPGAHGQPYDGIVLEAGYMGSSLTFSTVLIHEMGHYLGLYHTFEGGCPNGDCQQQGDRICDTPPDNTTARTPCPTDMNSCSTDEDDTSPNNPFRPVAQGGLGDQPDMKENYMDYSRLECYDRFSQGQKERMLSVVENIRSSLLDSPACIDPCPTPITAAFSASALSVPLGSTVNFTNTSANADSYEWAVDGTAFSTAVDASYTFNAEGNFQVTLTAFSNLSNCLPTDSTLTIEVFCPVEAGFTASDVSVLAGASVTFTNTSTNATSYTWLVNGTVLSTSPDYVLNTTEPGLYNVCLRATGPLCESLECSFVEASCSVPCEEICDNGMDDDNDGLIDCDDDDCPCFEDCGNTFVKTIGLPNTVDGATAIVAAGDGTFYIGGYLDEEAMIARVTAEGEVLWVRRFDFTDRPDHIINLYRDSDGFLVGASFGDDGTGAFGRGATAFRYDPENGQLLWVNYFNSRGTPDQILTNPANGNFYFSGGDILTTGAGNADNASLAELDRNTGAVLWRKEFNRGSSDRFFSILPVGNALYCLGRYTFDAYFEKMRVTLAAFTGNGNLEWSKYYLLSSTQNARMYGTSLKLDAGELVASFYGDPNGSDLNGSSTTGIMKTDLAGGLQWAKTYRLTGYPSLQGAFHLVVVPDGYLLYGYAISGDRDLVAIKTDKQGNALWAKAYGGLADDDLYYPFCKPPILQSGGNIYFVGRTRSGGSEDALLVKALADGSLDSDDCDFVREVAVTTNDWTNLFEADAGLQEQPNPNINPQLRMVQAVAASAESNILCQASPVDAIVAIDSAYCNGDSLAVALRICNEGTDTLFNALPYTFYDGNPTADPGATVLADGFTAPAPILPGECYSTIVSVPDPQGQQIYCIANDNGALTPVFSLETGFPPTEIIECDYTNNIDSASYETTVPDIDLGPDTSVCENGVFLLDAGPGFASYRWQDGAIGQTYTTFETGAFWVEATTACGDVVSDTINILLDTVIAIALRPDTSICPGNSVTLSTPQDPAYTYQWAPAATLDCSDCPAVTASPDSTTTYNLVVSNNTGCVSVDSVAITVEDCGNTLDTALCLGDSVLIEGQVFYPNETDTLQLPDGSSLIATVSALDTFYQALNLEACAGEPLEYNGAMLQPGQTELFTFTTADGCDSTIEVTALQLDTFFTTIDTAICQEESIDYNGTLLQPGQS